MGLEAVILPGGAFRRDVTEGEYTPIESRRGPCLTAPTGCQSCAPFSRSSIQVRVPLGEILDAVFYVVRGGCAWRLLPHDLPPWKTVYHNRARTGG